MGSGKTYWGRRLGKETGFRHFDLDEEIERTEGKPVKEIFVDSGESYFRLKEREVLQKISRDYPDFILSCGGGAPCHFDNMDFMNATGITVWLNPPEETLFQRLLYEREDRPLLKELDDVQLRAFISERLAARKKYYQQARYIVEDTVAGFDPLIEKLFHA